MGLVDGSLSSGSHLHITLLELEFVKLELQVKIEFNKLEFQANIRHLIENTI